MGRLDDIIDRNKHPRRHRKMRFPVGLMLSAFVLLILVLIIFTDSVISKDKPPQQQFTEPRGAPVYIYRAPAHHDAGAIGSAAPEAHPSP